MLAATAGAPTASGGQLCSRSWAFRPTSGPRCPAHHKSGSKRQCRAVKKAACQHSIHLCPLPVYFSSLSQLWTRSTKQDQEQAARSLPQACCTLVAEGAEWQLHKESWCHKQGNREHCRHFHVTRGKKAWMSGKQWKITHLTKYSSLRDISPFLQCFQNTRQSTFFFQTTKHEIMSNFYRVRNWRDAALQVLNSASAAKSGTFDSYEQDTSNNALLNMDWHFR